MAGIGVVIDQASVDRVKKRLDKLPPAYADACKGAGFELRNRMKEGIQTEAPGSEAWPPASPWTKFGSLRNVWGWRRSGGKRTWSATRYLKKRTRMSITGSKKPLSRMAGAVRVYNATSGEGTKGNIYIGFLGNRAAFLAAYHAQAHTQGVTDRMRRFLFAVGLGIRATAIKIPARPIVAPVGRFYGPQVPDYVRSRVAAVLRGGSGKGMKL